jgi:hypothetical protein
MLFFRLRDFAKSKSALNAFSKGSGPRLISSLCSIVWGQSKNYFTKAA